MRSNEQAAPRRLKFLIADDHANFRRVVRDFLPGPAPIIIECNSGAAAVTRFAEEQPDCIVMDIEMGGMNGIAAARIIRQSFPGARIIILSQHSDNETRAAALKAGASAFVPKEELEALRPLLAALLGQPISTPAQ